MGLCFRTAEAVALWPLPLPGKSIIPSYSFLQVICLLDAPAGQTQDERESHVSKHCAFCLQVPSQPQETGDTLILVLLNLGDSFSLLHRFQHALAYADSGGVNIGLFKIQFLKVFKTYASWPLW